MWKWLFWINFIVAFVVLAIRGGEIQRQRAEMDSCTNTLNICVADRELARNAAERFAEHVERLRRDCGKE